MNFLADRLKVQQREAGVRHDLIDAVFALGGEDDIVRLLARVKALQAFMGTDEGDALLAGYKRAANILKAEAKKGALPDGVSANEELAAARADAAPGDANGIPQTGEEDPLVLVDDPLMRPVVDALTHPERAGGADDYERDPAEAALRAALDEAEPAAEAAVAEERFEDAMRALAALRAPVDRFFDEVMVNDPDPEKRAARLRLLARMRGAVHRVADFSKIEG